MQMFLTVDAVVEDILGGLTDEGRAEIFAIYRSNLVSARFGWETAIREKYGLWRKDATVPADSENSESPGCGSVSGDIFEKVWESLALH